MLWASILIVFWLTAERRCKKWINFNILSVGSKRGGLQNAFWLAHTWQNVIWFLPLPTRYLEACDWSIFVRPLTGHRQQLTWNGLSYKFYEHFEKSSSYTSPDGIHNAVFTLWKALSFEWAIFPELLPSNRSISRQCFRSWYGVVHSRRFLCFGFVHVFRATWSEEKANSSCRLWNNCKLVQCCVVDRSVFGNSGCLSGNYVPLHRHSTWKTSQTWKRMVKCFQMCGVLSWNKPCLCCILCTVWLRVCKSNLMPEEFKAYIYLAYKLTWRAICSAPWFISGHSDAFRSIATKQRETF